jgi:hypothetical protein
MRRIGSVYEGSYALSLRSFKKQSWTRRISKVIT